MRRKMTGAAALAVLLCLGACTGPPWVLRQSADDISLRWYADNTPAEAAAQVAELHCLGNAGRNAELVAQQQDGSASVAQYRCR